MNNATMDRALKRVSIAASALIVVLMVNVNWVQGSGQADKYASDIRNPRKYAGVADRDRGQILAGGQVLAESYKPNKDGKKYNRKYDGSPTAAFYPVTGVYMTNGSKFGLERAYDSLLDGVDKRITVKKWFDQFVGKQPAGANVQTTIDPKAQVRAYNLLQDSTDRRAAAVVLDVKTGAIKVLASTPQIDPNTVSNGIDSQKAVDVFTKDSKQKFNPTVDKAMGDRMFPGSTFKIIMSAAGIESGRYNSNSIVQTKDLKLPESGQTLPNDPGAACAGIPTTLLLAFANSCNSSYGQMALDLGIQPVAAMAKAFGFESQIKVEPDMPSATSTLAGDGNDPLKIRGDALARTGIGQQNVQASPLQMAMVAQAVANNGTEMKPYLVDKVVGPDGSDLYDSNPSEFGRPIKPETASQLQDMMRAVVSDGTATKLQTYNVAGKTGTAETGLGNNTINERWFVGFYPANNPKYAFAVMTEGTGFGASDAGPIAGKLMQTLDGK